MSSRPPRIRQYYSNYSPPPVVRRDSVRPIASGSAVASATSSSSNHNIDTNFDPEEEHCRHCHSIALRIDWCQGDRVCTDCGLVAEERLRDDRPEWKEFAEAEDLAKGLPAAARCGMVSVDETKYIGGLQPTLLSKHAFGGTATTTSSTDEKSSYSLATIRNRLIGTDRKLNKLMEIQHRQALKDAKVEFSIRKKHRRARQQQLQQCAQENANATGDHPYIHHPGNDDEDHDDESTSSVRPEYESLLLQEEEDAHRMHAALYSDKWSLSRALRLYGTAHEQEQIDGSGGGDDDADDLVQRLDSTLRTAASDLYNTYSMLSQAAQTLNLPDRVVNEAKNRLVRYAARRDGFCVKGVSSRLSSHTTSGLDDSNLEATQQEHEQRKLAAPILRDYNRLKQMGSLGSAMLFLTARNLGWTRSLGEVCESFRPTNNLVNNKGVARAVAEKSFIKPKHSYRAMNEIKATFPDYARAMTVGDGTGGPTSGGGNVHANGPSLQPHQLLQQQQRSHQQNNNTSTADDADAMANFANHSLRRLQLPPVAEASIRILFAHCRSEQVRFGEHSGTKLSTLCAAVAYFVCMAGSVMQRLAQQANSKQSSSSSASPSSLMLMGKDSGSLKMQQEPEHQISSLKRPLESSKVDKKLTSFPSKKKRKTETPLSALDRHANTKPDIPVTSDDDDDDFSKSAIVKSKSTKDDDNDDDVTFDVFTHPAIEEDQSEKVKYEMRRMWDAWSEQMPWFRSVGEVEQSCGVSRSVVVEFYKANLYPRRKGLLQVLKDAASPQPHDISSSSSANLLTSSRNSLMEAPFASMLLDHIATAGPLMNSKGKN
jgi:transcription initiation factor TFIIIB Brf1 subunit/transcription initiation factor TFIIB